MRLISKIVFTCSILLSCCQQTTFAQDNERDWLMTEIEKIIRFDTEISFKTVPGFIIGVIDEDSTYIFPFGHKMPSKKSGSIGENDIFEIGSISKLYTTSIIRMLVQEKKLSYSQHINEFLPEEYQNPRLNHINIHSLIHHQSGLPLRPYMFGAKEQDSQNPYLYYTRTDLLEFFRDYIPEKEGFVYSHTNYALLELIIEKVTGQNFDDVFQRYLKQPLQLKNTFIDFPEQKENYISPGYDKAVNLTKPWLYSSFRASEGVKTSITDALKYLNFILRDDQVNMFRDSVVMDEEFPLENSFNQHLTIENGWHILQVKNHKIAIHTGRTSGHSCFMGMVKSSKTAVVIFSNSWVGTGDLGLQILRMINQNWKM